MKIQQLILASMLAASIAACGGGGSSTNTTVAAFDNSEFQGTWTPVAPYNCYTIKRNGAYYQAKREKPWTINSTTVVEPVTIYENNTECNNNKVGVVTTTYSATWNKTEIAGYDTVAQVTLTSTGISMNSDGNGSGIFNDFIANSSGVVSKILVGKNGANLYFNDSNSEVDANGFPKTLNPNPKYTKTN